MSNYYIKVLGVVQDGGYPHPGCIKECCKLAWLDKKKQKLVSSIAIIDNISKKYWLIDISPDFKEQLHMLNSSFSLEGIFLTHAHVGHYIGLLDLGLEVMNLKLINVYAMPEMKKFLENNAPINFLISNKNINPLKISNNKEINLNKEIKIIPFTVPHRNELSETVGYKVISEVKTVVYLPDIDSWNIDILNIIKENDILFLDGTFYDKKEIENRNIEKIPHPSILDSMKKFEKLTISDKRKIYFTHLNHTNNLLRKNSKEFNHLIKSGYNVADDGQEVMI